MPRINPIVKKSARLYFFNYTKEELENAFENTKVYFIENKDAKKVKIVFENNKLSIQGESTSKSSKEYSTWLQENKFRFVRLLKSFSQCEMTIYGEITEDKDFVLEDIYVNGNWVCLDDIIETAQIVSFLHYSPMYFGKYDYETLMKFFDIQSCYNQDKKINSIIVRPFVEDNDARRNRVIAVVSLNDFKSKIMPRDLEIRFDGLISFFEVDYTKNKWLRMLSTSNIEIKKENISQIMKTIVPAVVKDSSTELNHLSKTYEFSKEALEKELKKRLPTIIKKSLNI